MIITEISVSRSIEVFIHPGFPAQWVKAGAVGTVGEHEDLGKAFADAYELLGDKLQAEIKRIAPDQQLSAPTHIPPQGEKPERIEYRKQLAKCKTLADLSHFNGVKTNKDLFNERKKQINDAGTK